MGLNETSDLPVPGQLQEDESLEEQGIGGGIKSTAGAGPDVEFHDFSDEPLEIKSTPATRKASGTSLPGEGGMKGAGTEADPISPKEPTEFTVTRESTKSNGEVIREHVEEQSENRYAKLVKAFSK